MIKSEVLRVHRSMIRQIEETKYQNKIVGAQPE